MEEVKRRGCNKKRGQEKADDEAGNQGEGRVAWLNLGG